MNLKSQAKTLLHLASRFLGSLNPVPLSSTDLGWVQGNLSAAEFDIWQQMSLADRRHSLQVAQAVESEFNRRQPAAILNHVLAAALLHDCGKLLAKIGTLRRVWATLFWMVVDDAKSYEWLASESLAAKIFRRFARYRRHPELGQALLEEAGSVQLVAVWAGEHHKPQSKWSLPLDVAKILYECDND